MKRNSHLRTLGGLTVMIAAAGALMIGGQLAAEPAVDVTPTPYLVEFNYAAAIFGDREGPTATATLPAPTGTPYLTPTADLTTTPLPTATATTTPMPTSTLPLPTATEEPLATATAPPELQPTPAANPLRVLDTNTLWIDDMGRLNVRGEVQNDSNLAVRSIRITTEFINKKGRVVHREQALTLLDHVGPGEKTCFAVTIDPPRGWRTVGFGDITYQVDSAPIEGLGLSALVGESDDILGWYTVAGLVSNTSPHDYGLLRLVATLYDSEGSVAACDFAYTFEGDLDRGETDSFELFLADRVYPDVASFRVQAEGERR